MNAHDKNDPNDTNDTMAARAAPLTVCLVCNTAWAIYTYRHGLIRTLVAKGVRVIVIAPRDRTFGLLEQMGCRTIDLFVASKGTSPRDDLRTLLALYRHYRALRPNIVFHYTIKPNIYGSMAAWLARIPSVAVTTGLGYVFIRRSRAALIAKALYRFAFRFPRQIWFLNRDDQAAFVAQRLLVHPERARLLNGEGVDLDHFRYAPPPQQIQKQNFTFVLIGRLLWDKGVGEYVDAARRVRASHPDVRFQLLGPAGVDNPSAIGIETVRAWEREGIVEYLGEAHDVRAHIANAGCVVLPSYREGMPRTLMEASAMGRPVVATDVPGCRDVVVDGVTGLLCEPKNAASLADKLETVLAMSDAARRAMGERGRARIAEQFDEAAVIAHYIDTLAELTGVSL